MGHLEVNCSYKWKLAVPERLALFLSSLFDWILALSQYHEALKWIAVRAGGHGKVKKVPALQLLLLADWRSLVHHLHVPPPPNNAHRLTHSLCYLPKSMGLSFGFSLIQQHTTTSVSVKIPAHTQSISKAITKVFDWTRWINVNIIS